MWDPSSDPILLSAPASAGASPAHACFGPRAEWFGTDQMVHWTAAVAQPALIKVARQSVLVAEGAVARSIYIVQCGAFKVSRISEDGYEQVLDFASSSDVLGLDGLAYGSFLGSVEALEDSIVVAVPIGDVRELRASNRAFDARMQQALGRQWLRMRDMAWLMAAVGADRRTARFLVQQSRAMGEKGLSPRHLRLPMSRRDIAAHLGLAHESVSRALSSLASAGYLRVRLREVDIVDLEGLRRIASCTRGHGFDGEIDGGPRSGGRRAMLPETRATAAA